MCKTDHLHHESKEERYSGIVAATIAFIFWGFIPIYWKQLQGIPAYEILCHRMAWSVFVTLGLIVFFGRQRSLWRAVKNLETVITFTLVALLLAGNWLLYIWAINADTI
jgi:chloramphenicol-sensitive protein RarD